MILAQLQYYLDYLDVKTMLIKGVTQLNKIITNDERNFIIGKIKNTPLNNESNLSYYGNSEGTQIEFDAIFDRLTNYITDLTKLDLKKENSYSRIYKNGSFLKEHTDREGLDLTLSIQLENTFESPISFFCKGYDGTVYESKLNNCDSVLLKGRELPHWRDSINGEGSLICVFFHWQIVGLEYELIENFLSEAECNNIISEQISFNKSMVLVEQKAIIETNIRDNEVSFYNNSLIDKKILDKIGSLKLEGLQLLKYSKGNKFTPHFDVAYGEFKRLFTIIIYLNDDFVGGETNFINAKIKIKPKKGSLLIWKNIKNGKVDSNSLHESLKVIKGIKYNLVNWALV
jgi:Rps23 Pro-64 3,4-dihydroxylase Tpa1-like proline 4-hydroxylase